MIDQMPLAVMVISQWRQSKTFCECLPNHVHTLCDVTILIQIQAWDKFKLSAVSFLHTDGQYTCHDVWAGGPLPSVVNTCNLKFWLEVLDCWFFFCWQWRKSIPSEHWMQSRDCVAIPRRLATLVIPASWKAWVFWLGTTMHWKSEEQVPSLQNHSIEGNFVIEHFCQHFSMELSKFLTL